MLPHMRINAPMPTKKARHLVPISPGVFMVAVDGEVALRLPTGIDYSDVKAVLRDMSPRPMVGPPMPPLNMEYLALIMREQRLIDK